jgi:hypothetical protein
VPDENDVVFLGFLLDAAAARQLSVPLYPGASGLQNLDTTNGFAENLYQIAPVRMSRTILLTQKSL